MPLLSKPFSFFVTKVFFMYFLGTLPVGHMIEFQRLSCKLLTAPANSGAFLQSLQQSVSTSHSLFKGSWWEIWRN